MENSREYFFDHQSSRIDVCREGREPVPEAGCRSFIWDDKIKGITLQEEVYSSGNVNEERQVKVKVVIIEFIGQKMVITLPAVQVFLMEQPLQVILLPITLKMEYLLQVIRHGKQIYRQRQQTMLAIV